MRVLLDECIPRKFKERLSGFTCETVPEAGLAGKRTGRSYPPLKGSDSTCFLTVDKGLEFEQNLAGRSIAVVIIRAKSNRLADLAPYASQCAEQIARARAGQIIRVG
jgi:hypothetical protein